jgi:hypothetical protein
VGFIEVVEEPEEVAGATVGSKGEEIAEGGGEERGELLFREDFWVGLAGLLVPLASWGWWNGPQDNDKN